MELSNPLRVVLVTLAIAAGIPMIYFTYQFLDDRQEFAAKYPATPQEQIKFIEKTVLRRP